MYGPVKVLNVPADVSPRDLPAGRKDLRNDPETLTRYVKHIYKVLMTRGMKSCRVFVRDPALREYLKSRYTGNRR